MCPFFEKSHSFIRKSSKIKFYSDKLKVIGNPGGSGAMMWLTHSDIYVIKTVTHAQSDFLHQMLNGYYMTLHQNPNTLLTKFYGLFTLKINNIGRSIRIVVMRNFFPYAVELTHKFDLKVSTLTTQIKHRLCCIAHSSAIFINSAILRFTAILGSQVLYTYIGLDDITICFR